MTDTSLPDDAIKVALAQNWKEAIRINVQILKKNKTDVEALLRLAFAYLKIGKTTLAKQTYEKVLVRDKYNQIAQKNLTRLAGLKKKHIESGDEQAISPLMFLEEPGRTKIVDCIHIAPPNVLSGLSSGQEVVLKPRNHCIELRSQSNVYLGALPDDIAFKLLKFYSGGNTYAAIIKNVQKKSLRILIREVSRSKRFANQPSFTTSTSYVPFSRSVIHAERPDMTPTGEESDDSTKKE